MVGAGGAFAVEINVLSAGAVQEAEKAIAEDFRDATGNKVNFTVGTVGQIQEKLKSGAPADVIVVSATALEQLEKAGDVRARERRGAGPYRYRRRESKKARQRRTSPRPRNSRKPF